MIRKIIGRLPGSGRFPFQLVFLALTVEMSLTLWKLVITVGQERDMIIVPLICKMKEEDQQYTDEDQQYTDEDRLTRDTKLAGSYIDNIFFHCW